MCVYVKSSNHVLGPGPDVLLIYLKAMQKELWKEYDHEVEGLTYLMAYRKPLTYYIYVYIYMYIIRRDRIRIDIVSSTDFRYSFFSSIALTKFISHEPLKEV